MTRVAHGQRASGHAIHCSDLERKCHHCDTLTRWRAIYQYEGGIASHVAKCPAKLFEFARAFNLPLPKEAQPACRS